MYCSLLTHMKLKCKRWISRPFVLLTKFEVHIYTQATYLTQEMGIHANPLLGMIKVYFYIVLNFPSKPKKYGIKFGLLVLQRTGKFRPLLLYKMVG